MTVHKSLPKSVHKSRFKEHLPPYTRGDKLRNKLRGARIETGQLLDFAWKRSLRAKREAGPKLIEWGRKLKLELLPWMKAHKLKFIRSAKHTRLMFYVKERKTRRGLM